MEDIPRVRGMVHAIEETKTFGQRGFRKRLVVLEQPLGRMMSYIPLELLQESCELADTLSIGDEVEASYRLSGRKWQRDAQSEVKYFLSAEVIEFRVVAGSGDDPGPQEERPAEDDDEEPPF